MKTKRTGHNQNEHYDSYREKRDRIVEKQSQVRFTEGLLQAWEGLYDLNPTETLHKYLLHLRKKLREKRNQLDAMDALPVSR